MPASADPISGYIAGMVDNGTRGGSLSASSRSIAGSGRGEHTLRSSPGLLTYTISDPIILSDDEFARAESDTDFSDLDIDVRAKSDFDPLHIVGRELAAGGCYSGAALISDHLVTNHHDGISSKPQCRLSASRPRPASPDPGSDIRQAAKLQMNADHIQKSMSYDILDITEEFEGKGSDVFAEVDSRFTKGRTLPAVSDRNLASGNNISGLQDSQNNKTYSSQLALALTSLN